MASAPLKVDGVLGVRRRAHDGMARAGVVRRIGAPPQGLQGQGSGPGSRRGWL